MQLNSLKNFISYVVILTTLVSCVEHYQNVNWTYVIPNNYQGYLVVEFDCVGGSPLEYGNGNVEVVFTEEGISCISNSLHRTVGQLKVIYESGEALALYPKDGYGYCCNFSMRVGNERNLMVMWVGPIKDGQLSSTETVDEFLWRKLGIPPPR